MLTRSLRRERFMRFALAIAIWVALAYSVGWYHSITRIGVRGWPLPSPESLAAFGGYAIYLSKWNPPYETLWWFVLFPATGVVWVTLLNLTCGFFGGQSPGIMMSSRAMAFATLPIVLLGPLVSYYVWNDAGTLRNFYLKAAQFGIVEPEPWLGVAYFVCAIVSLIAQAVVHQRIFGMRGGKALAHFSVTWLILVCSVSGAAGLLQQCWLVIVRHS
jgi:hypothetical protein